MRFLYAKFIGYIGFYNGLGKSELSIDFSRCKNHICVINGANGTGKSTLLKALNLMPDHNENFVPNMDASKQLRLQDGSNIYDIYITHPIDKNNNRLVSKASICKNGVELNPNGNIGSYKDIIYNEFELDTNYITLTRLSGDDRGLADKKPADRKKFIASITSSLDTYNNIYKNLNKKANVLNSYLNNLSAKINNIGDDNLLSISKDSISKRYDEIKTNIDRLSVRLVSDETILKVNDPDLNIQSKWEELKSSIDDEEQISSQLLSFLSDIKKEYSNYNIDDIDKSILYIRAEIDKIKSLISDYSAEMISSKNSSSQSNDDILRYQNKISNITIDEQERGLKDAIDNNKSEVSEIESMFKQYGIDNIDSLSISEIDQVIKIVSDFIKTIDSVYEYLDVSDLEKYCNIKLKGSKSISNYINECISKDGDYRTELNNLNNEYNVLLSDKDTVELLDKRPKKCTMNECSFISKSLEVLSIYDNNIKNLNNKIDSTSKSIENTKRNIDNNQKRIEILRSYESTDACLDALKIEISSNHELLSKFSKIIQINDFDAVLKRLSVGYNFREVNDSISILEELKNKSIIYKSQNKIYSELLNKYTIYQNKKYMIDQYNDEIDKCKKNKEKQEELYRNYFNKVNDQNHFLEKSNKILSDFIEYQDKNNKYNESMNKLKTYKSNFDIINNKIKSSSDLINEVGTIKDKLLENKALLDPLEEQRNELDSQIRMVKSFKQEYGDYKQKYDTINILKKYSSPTKGGIQSLFMNMYMNKTLDLANQLLGMIFNGQYQLLEYVINENEFRIPFIGNGLPVDDISNGSTSQVCIMGMIINLVILNQASTKYNITSLDEIDGGLDHYNRMMFVDILQKLIQILNIDQLFIISHSVEAALNNVDLIQLSPINDYEDNFSGANIIYSYKDN